MGFESAADCIGSCWEDILDEPQKPLNMGRTHIKNSFSPKVARQSYAEKKYLEEDHQNNQFQHKKIMLNHVPLSRFTISLVRGWGYIFMTVFIQLLLTKVNV